MGKKNLASLMNGIMGEPNQEVIKSDNQLIEPSAEPESLEVTEEMKENLETKRYRNVGRPKKGTTTSKKEETRATFIVDPELIRKLKYISLVESSLLKDIISEALTGYINEWEEENGKIKLPKKK
ncbi:MAG: hypothetical protein HDQ88_01730 [Clostridia bacterium]|nr:hypothetical protein [Clostridia bacterium]